MKRYARTLNTYLLNERSQSEKAAYHGFRSFVTFWKKQTMGTVKRSVDAGTRGHMRRWSFRLGKRFFVATV